MYDDYTLSGKILVSIYLLLLQIYHLSLKNLKHLFLVNLEIVRKTRISTPVSNKIVSHEFI